MLEVKFKTYVRERGTWVPYYRNGIEIDASLQDVKDREGASSNLDSEEESIAIVEEWMKGDMNRSLFQ